MVERLANYVWDDGSVLTTSLWRAHECIAGNSRNGASHGQPSFIQGARMRGGRPLPGGPFHAAVNGVAPAKGHASTCCVNGSFDEKSWDPNATAQTFQQLQIQPPIHGVGATTGPGFLAYPAATVPDYVLYPDHVHQRHLYFAEMAFRQFQPGQVAQCWPQPSVPGGSYTIPVVPAGLQDQHLSPRRERNSTVTSGISPSCAGPPSNHPVSEEPASRKDQRPRIVDRRTVVVHNLTHEASQKDVELHLGSMGRVKDCRIERKEGENSKRCRAVVTFSTHSEATAAVERLNYTQFKGRDIQLHLWKEESSARGSGTRVTATSAGNSHPLILDGSVESDALSPKHINLGKK